VRFISKKGKKKIKNYSLEVFFFFFFFFLRFSIYFLASNFNSFKKRISVFFFLLQILAVLPINYYYIKIQ
jgi:hypothetical protein